MTLGTTRWRRRLTAAAGLTVAAAALGLAQPAPVHAAAPTASSQVAYLTDQPAYNIWRDALGVAIVADGTTYTTANASNSYTIHNMTMASIDVVGGTVPSTDDTLIVYAVCDLIRHQNAMKAINAFLNGGGKVLIMDGAFCTDAQSGQANYTQFAQPFVANYIDPIPNQDPGGTIPSSPYSFVGNSGSALTQGMPDCTTSADPPGCEPANSTSDGLQMSPQSTGWCEALGGVTNNGIGGGTTGAFMAYNHGTTGSGLVIYEGEAWSVGLSTTAQHTHFRALLDDMLRQPMNPDGLTCTNPLGTMTLSPVSDVVPVGQNETLKAVLKDGSGNPVSGVTVTFNFLSGLNSNNAPMTAVTDSTGTATVQYTSTGTTTANNPDVLSAVATSGNDYQTNFVTINWSPPVSVPETNLAVFVPVIGGLALLGLVGVPVVRRRRRGAAA